MKKVKLTSFAYRDSHPPETAHLVIDCREMRNPHRLGRLRELNGHDRAVQDYVMSDPEFKPIVGRVLERAEYGGEIAFGCFGGKHRSVAMAELTGKMLRDAGYEVEVIHSALPLAA
jgi:RNase adapter protein RapZ